MKAEPDVPVSPYLDVVFAALLLIDLQGLGQGLQHLVMGIGSAPLRIEGEGDHGGLDLLDQIQHRHHIAVFLRILGKDLTLVKAEAKVVDVARIEAEVAPFEVRFPLTDHPLELLDVGQVFFTGILGLEVEYEFGNAILKLAGAALFEDMDHIA